MDRQDDIALNDTSETVMGFCLGYERWISITGSMKAVSVVLQERVEVMGYCTEEEC